MKRILEVLRKAWKWIALALAALLGVLIPLYGYERRRRKKAEARAVAAEKTAEVAGKVSEAYRLARDDASRAIEAVERRHKAEVAHWTAVEVKINEAIGNGSGAAAINAAFNRD